MKIKVSTLFIALFLLTCCHHAPVASTPKEKPRPTSLLEQYNGPSETQIVNDYTILQLDAAANAFKVIFDESLGAESGKAPLNLFGCPVSAEMAKKSLMPLKSLIDRRQERDREVYLRSPAVYLRSRGADSCSSTCSCGVLADLLTSIDSHILKPADRKKHEDRVILLQSQAAKQGPEASIICAKKQTWICDSQLQTYLNHAVTAP